MILIKRLFLITAFLTSVLQAETQGIEFFHGTWEEALVEAKKTNKAIFVDAYTTWCGPCKAMAKNTFTKPEVGEFFNKNFINVKFDMEKEDGVKFGHSYPVKAYPTLYFIDDNGEVLKKVVGGQQPNSLITKAQEALKLNDKSGDFEEKYLEGDRSYDLVLNYVMALNAVDKPSLKISNEYLDAKPKITEEQRLKFIFEAAVEADSKIFEEVLANKDKIIEIVGQEAFDSKMVVACQKTFEKSIEFEYEDLMHESIDKAHQAMTDSIYKDFSYISKMTYYNSFSQKEKYFDAAKDYVKDTGKKNPRVLSYVAMDVCNNLDDDKKALKTANKWAKKAFEIDDSEANLNVYCRTLIALEEYDDVLKIIDKLIDENNPKYSKSTLTQIKNYTNNLKSNQG